MTLEQKDNLKAALQEYIPIDEEIFEASLECFKCRKIEKGDYFNITNNICRNLGLVTKGIFRIYYTEPETGNEVNLFFFRENQFMVSFKSFITQTPCYYTIEALEDSEIIQINHPSLLKLFASNHQWETFGRLLAEQYFYFSQARTESFIFKSAEQRYLEMMAYYPDIFERVPLYHISSYLGIKGPSLSRIRKKISQK